MRQPTRLYDYFFFGPGRLAPVRIPAFLEAEIFPSCLPGYVVGVAFAEVAFFASLSSSVIIVLPWR